MDVARENKGHLLWVLFQDTRLNTRAPPPAATAPVFSESSPADRRTRIAALLKGGGGHLSPFHSSFTHTTPLPRPQEGWRVLGQWGTFPQVTRLWEHLGPCMRPHWVGPATPYVLSCRMH